MTNAESLKEITNLMVLEAAEGEEYPCLGVDCRNYLPFTYTNVRGLCDSCRE